MVVPNPERPPEGERPPTWPVVFIEPDPEVPTASPRRQTGWVALLIVLGVVLPVSTWFAGRSSSRTASEPVPVPVTTAPAPPPPLHHQPTDSVTARPSSAPAPRPAAKRPARPAAPSNEPARVYINAVPWGLVSIDDNPIGNTPLVGLPLAPGTHHVRVEHAGYAVFEREVHLTPGESLRLTDIVLQEAAQ